MLPTAVLATSVRNSGARTADTSWCNTTIRQSRFVRPRNPLTFAVSKGHLSAHHWVRFPSQKRITGRIALNGRAPVSTTVSAQWESAGSSRCVRFAVACAITRPHHPCEVVCKRKNLGVSATSAQVSLVPQFCAAQYKGVLCCTKQGMNTAIYTEVQCFQYKVVRCARLGRQDIRSPSSRGFDSRHIH